MTSSRLDEQFVVEEEENFILVTHRREMDLTTNSTLDRPIYKLRINLSDADFAAHRMMVVKILMELIDEHPQTVSFFKYCRYSASEYNDKSSLLHEYLVLSMLSFRLNVPVNSLLYHMITKVIEMDMEKISNGDRKRRILKTCFSSKDQKYLEAMEDEAFLEFKQFFLRFSHSAQFTLYLDYHYDTQLLKRFVRQLENRLRLTLLRPGHTNMTDVPLLHSRYIAMRQDSFERDKIYIHAMGDKDQIDALKLELEQSDIYKTINGINYRSVSFNTMNTMIPVPRTRTRVKRSASRMFEGSEPNLLQKEKALMKEEGTHALKTLQGHRR